MSYWKLVKAFMVVVVILLDFLFSGKNHLLKVRVSFIITKALHLNQLNQLSLLHYDHFQKGLISMIEQIMIVVISGIHLSTYHLRNQMIL